MTDSSQYFGPTVPSGITVFTPTITQSGNASTSIASNAFTSGLSSSYSNDTNNIVPTSSSSDLLSSAGTSSSSGISYDTSAYNNAPSITFLDNIANDYHQFAYHICFYVTDESGAGTKYIIAESGVTGFNITNLVINSTIGPNATSSVANMT